jgi:hypothetical protein
LGFAKNITRKRTKGFSPLSIRTGKGEYPTERIPLKKEENKISDKGKERKDNEREQKEERGNKMERGRERIPGAPHPPLLPHAFHEWRPVGGFPLGRLSPQAASTHCYRTEQHVGQNVSENGKPFTHLLSSFFLFLFLSLSLYEHVYPSARTSWTTRNLFLSSKCWQTTNAKADIWCGSWNSFRLGVLPTFPSMEVTK